MSLPDLPEHLRTEELYRSAVELAPDSIITVDMQGVITSSNTTATRILGYSKDELVGRHFSRIGVVRARDVPKFLRLFKSAVRGELVEPLELTFYRKDGPPVLAEVRVGLLKENGKTIGLQAVSRDITKRRQAEEALRESEERLSVFMDSAPDAFALFDSELNLVEINRVGLGMFPDGSKKEGVIGKNIAELYPTMKETGRYDKYLEVVETGKSFFVDDVVAHPRFGEGHLTVRAFKVGEGLGLIVTDITERKQAEEALKEYSERLEEMIEERTKEVREVQEQLVRREKLAVLGQLAGGVGHELRNPLGAIKNAAYFLNMAVEEPDPEVKETLEILEKAVGTSERIISSLLDFARPKPSTRRKVDINEVLQEALSRATVPDNVEVVSQLDEALPVILADPDQLAQVFGNIILNAIQAMPQGGQLTVKSEAPREGWVSISLTDTGVGIPQENLGRLFEPLFTTKAKGIGLGLAVVKTLVEGHGGTIEVESEEGKGSTFTVSLPIGGKPVLRQAEGQKE